MFWPAAPLGRIPFLLGVFGVNTLGLIGGALALALHPVGNGHLAAIILMAAVIWLWFVLHGRRWIASGRGLRWPAVAAAILFAGFLAGYLVIMALWSVPAVQDEAFRTGGVLGRSAIETSPLVGGLGDQLVRLMGVGMAMVIAGLVMAGLGLLSLASLAFTGVSLLLPRRHDGAEAIPVLARPGESGGPPVPRLRIPPKS